jgi:hypothetical protein
LGTVAGTGTRTGSLLVASPHPVAGASNEYAWLAFPSAISKEKNG